MLLSRSLRLTSRYHLSLPDWNAAFPRRLFDNPYLDSKFHGQPICHFEIIANLNFRRFGLKMPIHTTKMVVLGFDPTNGQQ